MPFTQTKHRGTETPRTNFKRPRCLGVSVFRGGVTVVSFVFFVVDFHPSNFLNISAAFVPPKPKEFDSAYSMCIDRPVCGT